jgi:hypothetical protein
MRPALDEGADTTFLGGVIDAAGAIGATPPLEPDGPEVTDDAATTAFGARATGFACSVRHVQRANAPKPRMTATTAGPAIERRADEDARDAESVMESAKCSTNRAVERAALSRRERVACS